MLYSALQLSYVFVNCTEFPTGSHVRFILKVEIRVSRKIYNRRPHPIPQQCVLNEEICNCILPPLHTDRFTHSPPEVYIQPSLPLGSSIIVELVLSKDCYTSLPRCSILPAIWRGKFIPTQYPQDVLMHVATRSIFARFLNIRFTKEHIANCL